MAPAMGDMLAAGDSWRRGVDAAAASGAGQEAGGPAALEASARCRRGDPRRAGSALDAVEAAVRVLEDDPRFNAGRGTVLTAEGCIELDAAIMDGRDRRAGAVAGLTDDACTDQPRPAADRQGPARLPFRNTAPTDFAPRARTRAGRATAGSRSAERRRQLDELLARAGLRRRDQIWHGRRGCGRRRRPCRGRHLDRRPDRQTLGPDRRFAADRRRHLCRRPLRCGLGDRLGRVFHPRRRRPPAGGARPPRRSVAAGGARRGARRHHVARRHGRPDRGRA